MSLKPIKLAYYNTYSNNVHTYYLGHIWEFLKESPQQEVPP